MSTAIEAEKSNHEWLLTRPPRLTKQERILFEEAETEVRARFENYDYLSFDNPEAALSIEGQLDDLSFRLRRCGFANTNPKLKQIIDSIMFKLNRVGYFTQEYHKRNRRMGYK